LIDPSKLAWKIATISTLLNVEVFQRLGPNAGGGAKRGLSGCRSRDGVVICLVAGAALAAAGSMFGVWGS
jgi:hypothetical protein